MLNMSTHHAELQRVNRIEDFQKPRQLDGVHYVLLELPQFGISDVRKLIATAYRTPDGDATKQKIVIVTKYITVEAQQALLKVLRSLRKPQSFYLLCRTVCSCCRLFCLV